MDKNRKAILALLSGVVNGNSHGCDFEKLDMTLFMKLAGDNGLKALLYPACYEKLSQDEHHAGAFVSWTKSMQKMIIHNLYSAQQIGSLIRSFDDDGINAIIIKGMSIARLYQRPEYRTVGDLDIFIKMPDWSRAQEILEKKGYAKAEADDYHPLHVKFTKPGSIAIELHRELIHSGYLGKRKTEIWYRHIWEHRHLVRLEGLEFFAMSSEDELINQVCHFASHFVYYGTKLKHLFEMALIIKAAEAEMDWMYIEEALKNLGFYPFASLLLSACRTFFNSPVPDALSSVSINIQKGFVKDLINCYSRREEGCRGWLNILMNYRFLIKRAIFKPMVWAIEAKAQYSQEGLDLKMRFFHLIENIRMIHKKISVIKRFQLME